MAQKPTLKKPQPLTAAIIAYMQAGEERGDAQCAGSRVHCLASGQKVFFYRYRARDGALREIRLGEVGPLTLSKARDAVARKRPEREQGKDPQLEKRKEYLQARRERLAQRQATYTLENLVNEYIEEVLKSQKRGAESARILRQDLLPVLGQRPALQITRRELQDEVIRPRMAKAPWVTTQLLSRIRCAYAYAIEQGRLPDEFLSPTLGIKGAPQVRRKRVLTDAELATFLKWLPHSPYSRTVREALSLVPLTGCRSGEVVAAIWRDIDLDRGVWTIRETKNGEPHTGASSRVTTRRPAAKAALDHVAARLEAFPAYARVRKVWLTREPWTIEAGLITPTMKLKREVLAQQFKDPIEALYRDAG